MGSVWDPIDRFNPATFVYLFKTRTWISTSYVVLCLFFFFYISMTWGAFFHNFFRCCSLNNNTRRWIVFHAMTYLVFYYFKIKVHLSFVPRKSSILYFYAVIDILGKTIQNNLCAYATFYSNALFLVPQSGLRMKAIHFPQSSVHKSG